MNNGSITKHDGILGEIFPDFVYDPYRITQELSTDPNVIISDNFLSNSQEIIEEIEQNITLLDQINMILVSVLSNKCIILVAKLR